jgi:hypothetical protein
VKVHFYHNLVKACNKKKHFNYLLECFYIYPAEAIKPLIILLRVLQGLKKVSNIQGYV